MLFKTSLLLASLPFVKSSSSSETSINGTTESCLADVYFAVDSSAAMGPKRFLQLRRWVGDLSKELYNGGYRSTRIGLIRFGGSSGAEVTLPLTDVDDRQGVDYALARTFYTGGRSGHLEKAVDTFQSQGLHFSKGNRVNVRDILFVLTDHDHTHQMSDSSWTVEIGQKVKEQGVGVIVVAFTRNLTEVLSHNRPHPYQKVASGKDYYWMLNALDKQLKPFIDTAISMICSLANQEDRKPRISKWKMQAYGGSQNKVKKQIFVSAKPPPPPNVAPTVLPGGSKIVLFIPPLFNKKFYSMYTSGVSFKKGDKKLMKKKASTGTTKALATTSSTTSTTTKTPMTTSTTITRTTTTSATATRKGPTTPNAVSLRPVYSMINGPRVNVGLRIGGNFRYSKLSSGKPRIGIDLSSNEMVHSKAIKEPKIGIKITSNRKPNFTKEKPIEMKASIVDNATGHALNEKEQEKQVKTSLPAGGRFQMDRKRRPRKRQRSRQRI